MAVLTLGGKKTLTNHDCEALLSVNSKGAKVSEPTSNTSNTFNTLSTSLGKCCVVFHIILFVSFFKQYRVANYY